MTRTLTILGMSLLLTVTQAVGSIIGPTNPGTGTYPSSGMTELESIDVPQLGWSTNDESSAPRFLEINHEKQLAYLGGGGSTPQILVFKLDNHTFWKTIPLRTAKDQNVGTICSGRLVKDRNELWVTAAGINGDPGKVLRMTISADGSPALQNVYNLDGQPANYDRTEVGPRSPFAIQKAMVERSVEHKWGTRWWELKEWWDGSVGFDNWNFWWKPDGSWKENFKKRIWVGVFTVDRGEGNYRVEVRSLEKVTDSYTDSWCHEVGCIYQPAVRTIAKEWELLDQSSDHTGSPRMVQPLSIDPLMVSVAVEEIDNKQKKTSRLHAFTMPPSNTDKLNMKEENLSPRWDRSLDSAVAVTDKIAVLVSPTGNDTTVIVADTDDWSQNREYEIRNAEVPITLTQASYNQTDYSIEEAVDGILHDPTNGWGVFNPATESGNLPAEGVFGFGESVEINNITLNMSSLYHHIIKEFKIYTTTDTSPSLNGNWSSSVLSAANPRFINGIQGASVSGNTFTVNITGQAVYEIEFDPITVTAIKLEVLSAFGGDSNFVLSELEVSSDTLVGAPVVIGPIHPVISEISGISGELVFVGSNGKKGANLAPVFLQDLDPTEGQVLPSLSLTGSDRNIVTGQTASPSGPIYLVTRNRADPSDPYQVQKVELSPESAIRASKIHVPSATYPSAFNYYSHTGVGQVRLAIYTDNSGAPDKKVWESKLIPNTVANAWGGVDTQDYKYIDPAYLDSGLLHLTAGDYWLAWQYDGPELASEDPVGYIEGDPDTGYMKIFPFGDFPDTLDLTPPASRLTSENWALHLSVVDFVAHLGSRIDPPDGADAAKEPIISPTDAVFYHPGEQALYANFPDAVTVTWYDTSGNPSIVLHGDIVPQNNDSVKPMYHQLTNTISLKSAPGQAVVHYNREVAYRVFSTSDVANSQPDVYVDENTKNLVLPAHQEVSGTFVLTYENPQPDGTSRVVGVEVVQIIPPKEQIPVRHEGKCGHQLLPKGLPSDIVLGRGEILSGDDPDNRYVYLNNHRGPDNGNVYGVKPVGKTENNLAKVLFWQKSQGVEWPYQITDYHLTWPSANERITHIAGSPEVDLTGGGKYNSIVAWLYHRGAHKPVGGTRFKVDYAKPNPLTDDDITRAVIALWKPSEDGSGDRIEILVIDTFDHTDPNILDPEDRAIPWRVGRKIEDTEGFFEENVGTHCLECGGGYIYKDSATSEADLYYDIEIYGSSREAHLGEIFPVNEGALEVWWYNKRKGLCWAYRSKRYVSTWQNTAEIVQATASHHSGSNTIDKSFDGSDSTGWSAGSTLPATGVWAFDRPQHIGSVLLSMNLDTSSQFLSFELAYTGDEHPNLDSVWTKITENVAVRNIDQFATGRTATVSDGLVTINQVGQQTYEISFTPRTMTGMKLVVHSQGSSPFSLTGTEFRQEIEIATQEEYPVELDSSHQNVTIYHQDDPTMAGYKPNIEHGLVLPSSNGTQVFGLWDFNPDTTQRSLPSVPYVYAKFMKDGDWMTEIYRVFRGTLVYGGAAGLLVNPPFPLNAETGPCKDSYLYDISGAWVAPDKGVWLARGPDPNSATETAAGHATVEVGYYEHWEGECNPWLVPDASPERTPIRVTYQPTWPEFTQPECEPGTPNCYTTLRVGESVLRPGFSSAEIVFNQAGLALIDESKKTAQPLYRLPEDLLPTFPDLRHDIRERLSYDNSLGELNYEGIMTKKERDMIRDLVEGTTDDEKKFQEAVEQLYRWTNEFNVGVFLNELPSCFMGDLTNVLTSPLSDRLIYDEDKKKLIWQKQIEENEDPVTMTEQDRSDLKDACNDSEWKATVDELYEAANNPHTFLLGPHITVSAGGATVEPGEEKWASVAFTDSNMVEIFKVTCSPDPGEIEILTPDCFFDETVTLHWSGDGGGKIDEIYYHWQVSDVSGSRPAGDYNESFWIDVTSPDGEQGLNDLTVGGPGLQTVSDFWYRVRYRHPDICDGEWSDFTEPKLKEGWIKRVLAGLNLFDQRIDVSDPLAPIATYSDIIQELGPRFEGVVALNCTPDYVNELGLIEAYESVLIRAMEYTIDSVPPETNESVNQALELMSGRLAHFYTLLGDEAFTDASDPTVALSDDINELNASSMFSFKDQVPNLLSEELALLRGTDKMDLGDITIPRNVEPLVTHIYNKLPWNFTLGDGQTTYVQNYNILDVNGDGTIDAIDALFRYPQGHGDAWGHYTRALRYYYDLLRHPVFEWSNQSEAVNVNGRAVAVNYQHERAFAELAAKKAQAAQDLVELTYRSHWVDDPQAMWQGYRDSDEERAWGVSEWGRRAASGAYFDWIVANAVIPATDTNPSHQGTIERVDRTTTVDLLILADTLPAIQSLIDQADRGANPIGLDNDVVAFYIDGNKIDEGITHFEQMQERAIRALQNSQVMFNYANQASQRLREHQEVVYDFGRNVLEQDLAWTDRLIQLFGTPYTDDIGTGKTYPDGYDGPDIYHYDYVDTSPLYEGESLETIEFTVRILDDGEMLRRIQSARKSKDTDILSSDALGEELEDLFGYELDGLNPNDGDLARDIEFSFSARGLGLTKPESWVGRRRSYGRLQFDRRDALVQYGKMMIAMEEYDEYLVEVERAYKRLVRELAYRTADHQARVDANDFIFDFKAEAYADEVVSKNLKWAAKTLQDIRDKAKDGAEDSKNPVWVTSFTGALKVALSAPFTAQIWASLLTAQEIDLVGESAELILLRRENDLEKLLSSREIDKTMKEQLSEYTQLVKEAKRRGLQLRTQMELFLAAQERYFGTLGEAERLITQFVTWRKRVAGTVSKQRYDDLGFRVFRNDALEDYRQQKDIATRYVFLAAKAYDYETNLLGLDPLAGTQFLADIVRQDHIGAFDTETGEPLTSGSGLCSIVAQMKENFETALKPALGILNPENEGLSFSLRWELFRIPLDPEFDDLWEQTLQLYVVDDVQDVAAFREHCLSPWGGSEVVDQPAIVLRFPTEITPGKNFFGHPLGSGDSNYSSSHFATKIRRYGIWLNNYVPTSEVAGLAKTPRLYFVPIGQDVMRVPTINPGEPRYWNVFDQILPLPYPIQLSDLLNSQDWEVWTENFGQQSSFLTRNRYGDFEATPLSRIEAGEPWENIFRPDYVAYGRAVGRSVWNTEWMIVIPGINLNADPIDGLNGFIYGDGSEDSGIKDILLFFDTYSYSGAFVQKSKNEATVDSEAKRRVAERARKRARQKLLQLQREKLNIPISPEADMPPMILYGTMASAHDGGLISSGSVEVQLEYRPLEPAVMASAELSVDSASISYRVAVPVVESAIGETDRLQRFERYQANIAYADDPSQSSIADLPPADYGVAVAMPKMEIRGVFSGSPTFTPTQTPIDGGGVTPTPTPTPQPPTATPVPGSPTATPTPTGPTPTPTNTPWPEYLIYASLPLSGTSTASGEDTLRGAQLAVEDINRKGGIGGVPLHLVSLDNENRADVAIQTFQTAMDNSGTFAVIGGQDSENALAMAPYAAPNSQTFFSAASAQQMAGFDDFVVKCRPLHSYEVAAIDQCLGELGIDRVVVLAEDTDYGNTLLQGFYDQEGLDVIRTHLFAPGLFDVDAAVAALDTGDATGVAGIVVCQPDETRTFLSVAASHERFSMWNWVLSDTATENASVEGLPESFWQQIQGVTPGTVGFLDAEHAQDFQYQIRYGMDPTEEAYYGYDEVLTAANAIQNSLVKLPYAVWDAIPSLSFTGVTGMKQYDAEGELVHAVFDGRSVLEGVFVTTAHYSVDQPEPSNQKRVQKTSKEVPPAPASDGVVYDDFFNSKAGDDPSLGHHGGFDTGDGGWKVVPEDHGLGRVLMTVDLDLDRTDDFGRPFGFEPGNDYNLILRVERQSQGTPANADSEVIEVRIKSVCHYTDGQGRENVRSEPLVTHTVRLADWPEGEIHTVTIPFTYQSAEPDGVTCDWEGHRLKWDLYVHRKARQTVTLKEAILYAGPLLTADLDNSGSVDAYDLLLYVQNHRTVSGINPNFEWLLQMALDWESGGTKTLPNQLRKEVE